MGAAKMMDLRDMVSRTPPEGLEHWALDVCGEELARCGLVYEVEYVPDYSLLAVLDEWAKPKKVKVVRVTCSCCGGEYAAQLGQGREARLWIRPPGG